MSDTYCPAPWHGGFFTFSHQAVCCRHELVPVQSPVKFLSSEHVQTVKQKLMSGDLDLHCQQCQAGESNGTGNLRQIYKMVSSSVGINCAKDWSTESVPEYAEFRLSNLCNFKCRMCGPSASHLIADEVEQHPELLNYYGKTNSVKMHSSPEFINDIMLLIPKLKRVQFTGGEPTLIPEVIEIMDVMVDQGHSQNISLHITTNVSTINPGFFERLTKFKKSSISMSLDAVGQAAEYIRYGTKWNRVVNNVDSYIDLAKTYDNIVLDVSVALTAYNVMVLDQLFEFLTTKPAVETMTIMSDNWIFQPNCLRGNSRQKAIDSLSAALLLVPQLSLNSSNALNLTQQLQGFKHMLETQTHNDVLSDRFRCATRDLDRIRNQSFEQVFGVEL